MWRTWIYPSNALGLDRSSSHQISALNALTSSLSRIRDEVGLSNPIESVTASNRRLAKSLSALTSRSILIRAVATDSRRQALWTELRNRKRPRVVTTCSCARRAHTHAQTSSMDVSRDHHMSGPIMHANIEACVYLANAGSLRCLVVPDAAPQTMQLAHAMSCASRATASYEPPCRRWKLRLQM